MNNLPVVMAELVELALGLGVRSIKDLPGCWEHAIDARWWVAVNGRGEAAQCSKGVEVPRFTAYFECDGWPLAFVDPGGGTIVGAAGGEDALIEAIRAAKSAVVVGGVEARSEREDQDVS